MPWPRNASRLKFLAIDSVHRSSLQRSNYNTIHSQTAQADNINSHRSSYTCLSRYSAIGRRHRIRSHGRLRKRNTIRDRDTFEICKSVLRVAPTIPIPMPLGQSVCLTGCTTCVTTTLSPIRMLDTPAPSFATTPATSWPRVTGFSSIQASPCPLMMWRSVWQSPAASTAMRTCSGPGSGIERSLGSRPLARSAN